MTAASANETNRRFLGMCRTAIQAAGWLVLAGGVVGVAAACASLFQPLGLGLRLMAVFTGAGTVVLGIITLGLAQLIHFLLTDTAKPGWILRHGDTFLYLYVAIGLLAQLARHSFLVANFAGGAWLAVAGETAFFIAKALVLVGLGLVLRRVVPMVEESKTLV